MDRIHESIPPQLVVVKLLRQRQEEMTHEIEEPPGEEKAEGELPGGSEVSARPVGPGFGGGELLQAGSADDAVIVLGDALAAIEVAALRAARDGFPEIMVKAALAG